LHCFSLYHNFGGYVIEDLDIYIFVKIIVFHQLISLFDFKHNLLSKIMAFTAYTFFFHDRDKTCGLKSCN